MKKGIVHIIPLLIIATIAGVGSVGVIAKVRSQTISTSSVLSSSTENKGKGNEDRGPSENKGPNENSGKGNSTDSQGNSDNSSSQSKDKVGQPTATKQNTGGSRQVVKNETKIDVNEAVGEDEVVEGELEESTPSVNPGKKIRTNFPISINPLTNEKTVTTPGGVKTIILPEVAIQNMIKAGFPVILPPDGGDGGGEATPSATPESTPSGSTESGALTTVDESGLLLTEFNGELVYEIPAVKDEKFLGLTSVKIKVKGIVSAEDGEIVKLKKSPFDNILDLLSF